jgi:hypothetical protein
VRVIDPDTLVSKLVSVNAQGTWVVIIIYYFASLHHEAGYDSLKHFVFIVHVETQLACAQGSEVLSCSGYDFIEQLHNNSRFLKAFLTTGTNFDVHINLSVCKIKLRHCNYGATPKELCKLKFFFLTQRIHFFQDNLPVSLKHFVLRFEFKTLSTIMHS